MPRAFIFGHADSDGYVATEQTRRNLEAEGFTIDGVKVDPKVTWNYRFWERGFLESDFRDADLVVTVDIMLDPRDPLRSFAAICSRVGLEPNRRFIVIDHHPIADLPKDIERLEIQFVEEAYHCCYGEPSDLMILAAVCEGEERTVMDLIDDRHYGRALGIRRAAADMNGLAGEPLLKILREERWSLLDALAREPSALHRTYYGRRWRNLPPSHALRKAREATIVRASPLVL